LKNEAPTSGLERGLALRETMHARLAQGMSPMEVGRQLVEAIRENRLYVLTDHEWDPQVGSRAINILTGSNPTLT
jgi:hypothetical protein